MNTPQGFTYQYQQPADYHFCQDSVILPRFVAEHLRTSGISSRINDNFRTLDLCAGCGVIGLELAFHAPRIRQMDFLEIQSEFREAFVHNRGLAQQSPERFRFIEANYTSLLEPSYHGTYDLIVSNPPYFYPGEGRLSPSELQNRCRFFIDSDLKTLLRGVANALKEDGVGLILVKSGERHGRNALRDAMLSLAGSASATQVADIRGTSVIELKRI